VELVAVDVERDRRRAVPEAPGYRQHVHAGSYELRGMGVAQGM
jgi:hypothetical protein